MPKILLSKVGDTEPVGAIDKRLSIKPDKFKIPVTVVVAVGSKRSDEVVVEFFIRFSKIFVPKIF